MHQDFSRAPVSAPSDAPPTAPPILFTIDLVALRAHMDALRLDDERLAYWSSLPLKQVRLVLETGVATRAQARRMRRGLRFRAIDLLDRDAADAFWRSLTLRSLAPEIR